MFFSPISLIAQKRNIPASYTISPSFESLYSTHGNFFYSQSIQVLKKLNKKVEFGGGVERAYSPIHHDNGFVLYKLNFIPVYGNIKYCFMHSGRLYPFVESSVGVSFNSYKIASDDSPTEKSNVNEAGVYLYAGGGTRYLLFKNISLVSALGFKGYKMSFNVYDINPHGVTYLIGLCFKLS